MRNTNVIKKEMMECLIDNFGIIETEIFLSSLLREPFDYTEWQRDYFDKKYATTENFLQRAADYETQFPFKKN
ncbi:MAG: hypothetical protein LBK82_14810 [Planctomycetaceae bacterium]|jgi:hypothetical protein|nr:hypothetical protein [Planctomycetaceae bacterium]